MNATENVKLAFADVTSESKQNQLLKDARLSHIKKEKSRDAARSRRGRENCQFYALATLLPIPEETSSLLDKASIIRLTMSYLQLQKFFASLSVVELSSQQDLPKSEHNGYISDRNTDISTQGLDGFLFIISNNDRCLFVSNSISEDLGLAQIDVIGSNFSNFIHPSDHEEFHNHLESQCCEKLKQKFCQSVVVHEESSKCCCSFFIRMKSSQPRRSLGIKSPGYKVIHVCGSVITKEAGSSCKSPSSTNEEEEKTEENTKIGFVGIARVLSHAPVEILPHDPVFVMKVDRSLQITFCEEQLKLHTNYEANEVRGCTIYQFVHTCDLHKIQMCHIEMLNKGALVTPYFRWLLKNGTFLWVQSRCSIILEKHHDEDYFLWIISIIARGQDDIPSNFNATPNKVKAATNRINKSPAEDRKLSEVIKVEAALETPVHNVALLNLQQPRSFSSHSVADEVKPADSKLVKQSPEKAVNLKRVRSSNSVETNSNSDEPICLKYPKVNPAENRVELTPLSTVTSYWNGSKESQEKNGDVLDVNSTMWGNPPNREVTNHSDLYTTVIHHHYPYGIDPNLLNSNPIFAKMLTTNYVTYESLFQRDAFILPPPTVNIFTPVLGTLPQLLPAQPKLNYCPPSVASIIDELRKDPIREKNPPNKVVLTRSHIPSSESILSPDPSPRPVTAAANPAPVFTFPSVSNLLRPVSSLDASSSNPTPIFLHPVKLASNTVNSLPI